MGNLLIRGRLALGLYPRQSTLHHELNCRVHVGGNNKLAGMSRGPDPQQLIYKSLTDVGHAAEIYLDIIKVGVEPIQEPPGLAARNKGRIISKSLTTGLVVVKEKLSVN
jgi:hypothetical protein